MPKIVIIQGSLSKNSNTALVIQAVAAVLKERNIDFELVDLREVKMEFCDGRDLGEYNEEIRALYTLLESAEAYIIGFPVYNYTISAAVKNLIEICSSAMNGKFAGIVSNSGGVRSFMASVDLMKVLSYHDNIMTVQPTVHTFGGDFANGKLANPKVIGKINAMVDALLRFLD